MLFSSGFWFIFCLVGGTVLSVSSDSWFGAWCGLELNLISFIPFVAAGNNQYSSEASLKYFLIQALGSAVIILGAVSLLFHAGALYMMTIALLLKMGAAPLHFWFPQVMEGLGWYHCVVLMTLQKIAPIVLLSYLITSMSSNFLIFGSSLVSAVVGAIGGINQMSLRKIMAFSSINHMAWMLLSMLMSETSWGLYFLFYTGISISVVLLFQSQQSFHFSQLVNSNNPLLSATGFMSMLSLGGLPPFTGFIPKWIIIQEMVHQGLFFPLLVLLLSSLLTLYYYLRIVIMYLFIVSPQGKWNNKSTYFTSNTPMILLLNFSGLLLPSIFMLT